MEVEITRLAAPYPLCGPRLKLERAERHLADLRVEVEQFLQTQPYRLTSEEDDAYGERLFRVHIQISPPERLGPLIGDCVHNLRSSLDHLISAVAREAGIPDNKTYFPTCHSITTWNSFRQTFAALSPRALRVIEGFQPYQSDAPKRHVLYVLNKLWNYDKHRDMVLTGPCLTGVASKEIASELVPIMTPGIIDDGAIILRVPSSSTTVFEGTFRFDVAFGPGSPRAVVGASVTTALSLIHEYVRDTVLPNLRPPVLMKRNGYHS